MNENEGSKCMWMFWIRFDSIGCDSIRLGAIRFGSILHSTPLQIQSSTLRKECLSSYRKGNEYSQVLYETESS